MAEEGCGCGGCSAASKSCVSNFRRGSGDACVRPLPPFLLDGSANPAPAPAPAATAAGEREPGAALGDTTGPTLGVNMPPSGCPD